MRYTNNATMSSATPTTTPALIAATMYPAEIDLVRLPPASSTLPDDLYQLAIRWPQISGTPAHIAADPRKL